MALDLLIAGARLVDGTGAPAATGDLGVVGDRIVALGRLGGPAARRTIQADGLVLAPGFIDSHTHDDRALLTDPAMRPKVTQGVTTVITGNCGISLAPVEGIGPPPLDLFGTGDEHRYSSFAAYAGALMEHPPTVNSAALVGHTSLRVRAMRDISRAADEDEIAAMRRLLAEALDDGAIGLSTGTFYGPAKAAPAAEIEALARLVGEVGGIYATHMRDEGEHVLASLDETFATAEAAGVPVVISHHKCAGRPNWGRSVETLARIAEARGRQPVGLDAYPYNASSTVLVPSYVEGAEKVLVTWSAARPDVAGRWLEEIAAEWRVDRREAASRLLPAGAVYFSMHEDDVRRILAFPETMIGSDGLAHDRHPHPRLWGTFPRVLGHYARDEGLFGLEEAVRRMTGLTAQRFRLAERGLLREGAFADLVLFDPAEIADRATFAEPTRPAAGIHAVWVNGAEVLAAGEDTGERPGRLLRRQAA
jgi:N-acyl-D-amino-acid deacylase